MRLLRLYAASLICATPVAALASQAPRGLDSLLAPHRSAMKALAGLDGVWQGEGRTFSPTGGATFRQTIRVTSLGEGTIKLLEGRSSGPDGGASNYSVEIVSFVPSTAAYSMRLYTQGIQADVPIKPLNGGFTLEYPDGTATIRFTVTVTADTWHEIAERRAPGAEAFRFLELSLHRTRNAEAPGAPANGSALPSSLAATRSPSTPASASP